MTGASIVDDAVEAVADIADGATVMIGGFGSAGQPVELIEALIASGATDLTVVSNNAGNGDHGLAALIREGRVRKMICSFPRQSDSWYFDAELPGRRRSSSSWCRRATSPSGSAPRAPGIGAFFTPTGYGTPLAEGKETRVIDGRGHVLEYAAARRRRAGQGPPRRRAGQPGLPQDRTQLRADHGRRRRARPSSRSTRWSPVGALDPEHVVTPCIYVDRVVQVARALASAVSRSADDHDQPTAPHRPIDRDGLARVVAADIPAGSFVNLGIGLPTTVVELPRRPAAASLLHTENGMLGMGPEARGDEVDPDLVNAGKVPVTELPGASYFHHADSFAMMRGGHLDICVLGAYQVSARGDLANWHTGRPGRHPRRRRRDGPRHRRQADAS